jgi:hypothetical protein
VRQRPRLASKRALADCRWTARFPSHEVEAPDFFLAQARAQIKVPAPRLFVESEAKRPPIPTETRTVRTGRRRSGAAPAFRCAPAPSALANVNRRKSAAVTRQSRGRSGLSNSGRRFAQNHRPMGVAPSTDP